MQVTTYSMHEMPTAKIYVGGLFGDIDVIDTSTNRVVHRTGVLSMVTAIAMAP